MLISANWLSEYVRHELTPNELADLLTMAGLEVESVERIGLAADGIVVGEVTGVREHPNADRLRICTVNVGGAEPLSIVCGAPNVAEGQMVPVAPTGTTLHLPSRDDPDERTAVTIRKTKIRGEVSEGMICAEDELGLGSDHSGIMVLDDDARPGLPLTEYLSRSGVPASDHVIDVAITPNRPDAISHIGMARDVAAITGISLETPDVDVPEHGGEAAERVTVDVRDTAGCTRYVGILVEDVQIGESPDWMKRRLEAVGLRPRNVIVDITNYVMYECGQPLHAFDFDRLADGTIVVHSTDAPTRFTTLDDKERELPAGTLMIADAERDVAIAGVMGGQNSEVSAETRNVLIESAWFDPSSIRKTSKALQLQTDASYRFERGVDPSGQARAAARAAQLMVELAGGKLVPGMVDAHPSPHAATSVDVRAARIRDLLGVDIPTDTIERLLTAIGFELDGRGGDTWTVTVPPHRPDVEREVDVIEEVARLFGFDNIPEPTHSRLPNFTPGRGAERLLRDRSRSALAGAGFREIYTNSMLSVDVAEAFHLSSLPGARPGAGANARTVETINPITTEMSTLRPSLLPGALRVAAHNQNHGRTALRLFELGRVHTKARTARTLVGDYTETEALILAASGEWIPGGWSAEARATDLYDMKGACEYVLARLGIRNVAFDPTDADFGSMRMDISADGSWLGTIGRVEPGDVDEFDLRREVYFAEFDFTAIAALGVQALQPRFEAVSRFPEVDRDLAVLVDADARVGEMLDAIRSADDPLLRDAGVFDLYEGEGVPEGKKSVAFSLRFGADRTLRDNEVDESVSSILELLKSRFDAVLR
ncbi:MAG: phenylalanine--tRNA ligase subunit beta [Rhodothermales bacterium]|nr:phenylalanine--tRNA ligase subunit beta [Rhodothermales bacterium]